MVKLFCCVALVKDVSACSWNSEIKAQDSHDATICGKILLQYFGCMHLPIHRLDPQCVMFTWITVMPELCVGNTGRDN